jgi:DNA polymerase III delta subunit
MTAPALGFFWGDDDLAIGRAVRTFGEALDAEAGSPLERWPVRGADGPPAIVIGRLVERISTPVLFGGGTLSVVAGVGPLVKRSEDRDALLGALRTLGPGNGVAFVEPTESGRKQPPHKPLVDAIQAQGGIVRELRSPRAGALAGWIEAEAKTRSIRLAPGAARELATRVGGFVQEGDAERGYQTRLAAMELDKLAIRRPDGPITPDDVRELAAEAIPSSLWALGDAVGMRRVPRATELLERHLESTPEPVLVTVLYRRIRELLEVADRLAAGESPGSLVRSMRLAPFRAEKLVEQARTWSVAELSGALDGLVELDATVRGAPGMPQGDAQHRLAFGLWLVERVGSG